MKNQNRINLIRKNVRSKRFIKSSLQKACRARDNRWNKNSELIQDDFEPYDKEEELDVFRKIKPWGDPCWGDF
jgi:hypothetical protein